MIKEYRNFWNEERVAKAKAQGLTPVEATILASIVHKESVKKRRKTKNCRSVFEIEIRNALASRSYGDIS
jgi:cell division protein YceG involved in septum cleavage